MLRLVPIAAMLSLLAGCSDPAGPPAPRIEHAIVNLPAVPGRPGVAYFSIRTAGGSARLLGVTSPDAARIELHETVSRDGMSAMGPVRDTSFSPDAPLVFAPGGKHAMLFDIAPSVRVGGTMRLAFAFDALPPVTVEAEVRGPGGGDHAGH